MNAAQAIAHFLRDLCVEFPGLLPEHDDEEVNGGDLVDYMGSTVKMYREGPFWPSD